MVIDSSRNKNRDIYIYGNHIYKEGLAVAKSWYSLIKTVMLKD